ncbi:hypothetical protein AVEN_26629-1, partial [Araneus ventricosus]
VVKLRKLPTQAVFKPAHSKQQATNGVESAATELEVVKRKKLKSGTYRSKSPLDDAMPTKDDNVKKQWYLQYIKEKHEKKKLSSFKENEENAEPLKKMIQPYLGG